MTDPTSTRSPARDLWLRIETIHAVTYFGSETQEAAARVGLDRFWVGYFALRAAPLGAVDAGVVMRDARVREPAWTRQYLVPGRRLGGTTQADALEVLAEHLEVLRHGRRQLPSELVQAEAGRFLVVHCTSSAGLPASGLSRETREKRDHIVRPARGLRFDLMTR